MAAIPKKRSIQKARDVVVVHSDRKDPPDLQRLTKALIAWRLEKARTAKHSPKKTKLDQ